MTTKDGRHVQFQSQAETRVTFQWPIELFLLIASEATTMEEFRAKLMVEDASHWVARDTLPKVAVAATGGAK